eukprot:1175294-Alexandrium_andersonii.AAC.1
MSGLLQQDVVKGIPQRAGWEGEGGRVQMNGNEEVDGGNAREEHLLRALQPGLRAGAPAYAPAC